MTGRDKPYDLCILGCGPAGFAGAMAALDLGRRVCLIEPGQIGGAGVMWGALASKTMWELAKDYFVATRPNRGYHISEARVDYTEVRQSVFAAVREKQSQMRAQIEAYSAGQWNGPGCLCLKSGRGSFRGPHEIQIDYADGRRELIGARKVLITVGSQPRQLPNIPAIAGKVFDSDTILKLKQFPRRLMIVGAGIIGCEYATIFANYGQTQVDLIDHKEHVIPYEDEDLSIFVGNALRRRGVTIHHSAKVRAVTAGDQGLEGILELENQQPLTLRPDAVLVAVGRVPDLAPLAPERAGLEVDLNGYLPADANCRVKDQIYAAGDVTRHPALVNIAEAQARHAVNHMFGKTPAPLQLQNMSTVMFFHPPVAAVGFNEKICRERKIPHRVAVYANALLSRAIAMRSTRGFVKIIIGEDADQRILGMRAAGPQASSTIMAIALLMDQNKGLGDIIHSLYPHPTMSEGIQECLRVLSGQSIYKPHAFPGLIQIRTWHPGDPPPDTCYLTG
ncbi:MAG: NAD(P)/FAD-dependent oxidoreductase [Desulfobacterales bacterium]